MKKAKLAIHGGTPVRKSILPFGRPDIRKEEIKAVSQVLGSRWIGTGPKVAEFENAVKQYVGARYAFAINSASAALHIALLTSGVGSGDEVITTPITFPSTINMIENVGAKPVFVDVEADTGLIDPYLIEKAITKKTKATMPVHLYGQPCDMDAIRDLAKKYNLVVIEDAAEAFGAQYNGKKIGSQGEFVAFSFAVNKVVTCAEGGILVTSRKDMEDKIKLYILHGMNKNALKKYPYKGYKEHFIQLPGFKYNMTEMHAAIGLVHLERIDKLFIRRDHIWERYDNELQGLPLRTPRQLPRNMKHGRGFYAIQFELEHLRVDRNATQSALLAEGIGTSVHFYPMHLQPYYVYKYGYQRGSFPNAENLAERTLSLPLASDLTDKDIDDVVKAVRKVVTFYIK